MLRATPHCYRWSRYETQPEAMRAIARRRRSRRMNFVRDKKRTFFCQHCGGWHMGHWLSAWIG